MAPGGRSSKDQQFSGKKFFLDIRGQTRTIENDLRSLGGKVDTFLSKEVNYIITNRSVSTPRKTQATTESERKTKGTECSRGRAMVTRSNQTKQPEVRSYAVGVAAKWRIQVLSLTDLKQLIAGHQAATSSRGLTSKAGQVAPSHQFRGNLIKVEDKSRKFQPEVKRPSTWPKPDFTPSAGSPFTTDALSPPRTRSAGRKTSARKQPAARENVSPQRKTRQNRQVDATRRSAPTSPAKPSPRAKSPRVTKANRGPNVTFQLAKIPPASEVIPKMKPMKKVNVTMRRVKRQLDFDDVIIPSPVAANTKVMMASKKLTILRELQVRLDGIPELSPVKAASRRQPARSRKSSTSPKPVTVARLARQLKKELQQTSPEIAPMSLRNGKMKFAAY